MGKTDNEDIKERSRLSKKDWREYTKTIWTIRNVTSPEHPAVFPEEIPRRLIKMFTFVGETVLDPFAGICTTLLVSKQLGRNSVGIEINPKYVEIARKRLTQAVLHSVIETKHEIYCADSRDLSFLGDRVFDLIVTSPPYWNKVKYGNLNDDLANIDDFEQFVEEVSKTFKECFKVLRPGRRMCIITANVHKETPHGLLRFPLATDYIIKARQIGFHLVNEVIWSKLGTGGKWGSFGNQRPIFGSYPYPPNFLFKDLHEYILIFKKP